MELDDYGRTNLVWYAGQNTGFTLYNGVIQYPTDGVKVVLHDDDQLIHAYPIEAGTLTTIKCITCVKDILI